MTIEAQLQSIAVDLKRIADALEGGNLIAPAPAPADDKPDDKPAGKAPPKKDPPKKDPPKKAPPKEEKEDDGKGPSLADVRKALVALQKSLNDNTAPRDILKKIGGVTVLGKLDKEKFAEVIAAAEAATEGTDDA